MILPDHAYRFCFFPFAQNIEMSRFHRIIQYQRKLEGNNQSIASQLKSGTLRSTREFLRAKRHVFAPAVRKHFRNRGLGR